MAAEIRLPVRLDVLLSSIQELKAILNNLKPDSKAYRELLSIFQSLGKEIDKIQVATAKPLIDQKQFNGIDRSIDKIEDGMNKILLVSSRINFNELKLNPDLLSVFNEFTREVNAAKQALGDLKGELKNNLFANVDTADFLNKLDPTLISKSFDEIVRVIEQKTRKINEAYQLAQSRLNEIQSEKGIGDKINSLLSNKDIFNEKAMSKFSEFFKLGDKGQLLFLKGKRNEFIEYLKSEYVLKDSDVEELRKLNAELIKKLLNSTEGREKVFGSNLKLSALAEAKLPKAEARVALTAAEREKIIGINSQLLASNERLAASEQKVSQTEAEVGARSREAKTAIEGQARAAASGSGAFNTMATLLLNMRDALVGTNASFLKMQRTINNINSIKMLTANFLGFTLILNIVKRSIKDMFNTIKEVDNVITNIAIVTNKTNSLLWNEVGNYAQLAQKYGATTKGAYEISQIYYQQGLGTNDVLTLTNETLKLATISGLDYATATDYMTTALRGFKMEMSEAATVVDVYSNLAAHTAVTLEELSVAMSKTASSLESVGATLQQGSAMIGTMVAVTRESATNIGSALKSIASRYGEMKKNPLTLGTDEDGEIVDYNKVDTALKSVGISLKDTNGQFRNMTDVIVELAEVWEKLDTTLQRYIATQFAGNRQQSRFLALVSNERLLKANLGYAENSEGTGDALARKAMTGIERLINKLKASYEQFYLQLGLEDSWLTAIKCATSFMNTLTRLDRKAEDFFGNKVLGLDSYSESIKDKEGEEKEKAEKILEAGKKLTKFVAKLPVVTLIADVISVVRAGLDKIISHVAQLWLRVTTGAQTGAYNMVESANRGALAAMSNSGPNSKYDLGDTSGGLNTANVSNLGWRAKAYNSLRNSEYGFFTQNNDYLTSLRASLVGKGIGKITSRVVGSKNTRWGKSVDELRAMGVANKSEKLKLREEEILLADLDRKNKKLKKIEDRDLRIEEKRQRRENKRAESTPPKEEKQEEKTPTLTPQLQETPKQTSTATPKELPVTPITLPKELVPTQTPAPTVLPVETPKAAPEASVDTTQSEATGLKIANAIVQGASGTSGEALATGLKIGEEIVQSAQLGALAGALGGGTPAEEGGEYTPKYNYVNANLEKDELAKLSSEERSNYFRLRDAIIDEEAAPLRSELLQKLNRLAELTANEEARKLEDVLHWENKGAHGKAEILSRESVEKRISDYRGEDYTEKGLLIRAEHDEYNSLKEEIADLEAKINEIEHVNKDREGNGPGQGNEFYNKIKGLKEKTLKIIEDKSKTGQLSQEETLKESTGESIEETAEGKIVKEGEVKFNKELVDEAAEEATKGETVTVNGKIEPELLSPTSMQSAGNEQTSQGQTVILATLTANLGESQSNILTVANGIHPEVKATVTIDSNKVNADVASLNAKLDSLEKEKNVNVKSETLKEVEEEANKLQLQFEGMQGTEEVTADVLKSKEAVNELISRIQALHETISSTPNLQLNSDGQPVQETPAAPESTPGSAPAAVPSGEELEPYKLSVQQAEELTKQLVETEGQVGPAGLAGGELAAAGMDLLKNKTQLAALHSLKLLKYGTSIGHFGQTFRMLGTAAGMFALALGASNKDVRKIQGWSSIIGGVTLAFGLLTAATHAAKAGVEGVDRASRVMAMSNPILGVAMAVMSVASGLLMLNTDTEDEIEDMEETVDRLTEIAEQAKEDYKVLSTNALKLEELKELRYENEEAMQEYLDAVDLIVEQFPELIAGYDEEGKAVINLIELLKKLKEAREANDDAIIELEAAKVSLAAGVRESNLNVELSTSNPNGRPTEFASGAIVFAGLQGKGATHDIINAYNEGRLDPTTLKYLQEFGIIGPKGDLYTTLYKNDAEILDHIYHQAYNKTVQEGLNIIDAKKIDYLYSTLLPVINDDGSTYAAINKNTSSYSMWSSRMYLNEMELLRAALAAADAWIDKNYSETFEWAEEGSVIRTALAKRALTLARENEYDKIGNIGNGTGKFENWITGGATSLNEEAITIGNWWKDLGEANLKLFNEIISSRYFSYEDFTNKIRSLGKSTEDTLNWYFLLALQSVKEELSLSLSRLDLSDDAVRDNAFVLQLMDKIKSDFVYYSEAEAEFVLDTFKQMKQLLKYGTGEGSKFAQYAEAAAELQQLIFSADSLLALDEREEIISILETNGYSKTGLSKSLKTLLGKKFSSAIDLSVIEDMISNTYSNFNLTLEAIAEDFINTLDSVNDTVSKLSKGMTHKEAESWIKSAQEYGKTLEAHGEFNPFEDLSLSQLKNSGNKFIATTELIAAYQRAIILDYTDSLNITIEELEKVRNALTDSVLNDAIIDELDLFLMADLLGRATEFFTDSGELKDEWNGRTKEIASSLLKTINEIDENIAEKQYLAYYAELMAASNLLKSGDLTSLDLGETHKALMRQLQKYASGEEVYEGLNDDVETVVKGIEKSYSSFLSDLLTKGIENIDWDSYDYLTKEDLKLLDGATYLDYVKAYAEYAGKTASEINKLMIQAIEKMGEKTSKDAIKDFKFINANEFTGTLSLILSFADKFGLRIDKLIDEGIAYYDSAIGSYVVNWKKLLKKYPRVDLSLIENFDTTVAESMMKNDRNYETILSTLSRIEELKKRITNEDNEYSETKINQYKEELALAEKILQIRSTTEDASFKFMSNKIPGALNNPINYMENWFKAIESFDSFKTGGWMDYSDFYNMFTELGNLAEKSGEGVEIAGKTYKNAQDMQYLIELAALAMRIDPSDGKYKINLSALKELGIDFTEAGLDMKSEVTKGVQAFAASQVKMLDAVIQMLEVIVAMEGLESLADENNEIDISKLFPTINGDGLNTLEENSAAWTMVENWLSAEEGSDMWKALENIELLGKKLREWAEDAYRNGLTDEDAHIFHQIIKALYKTYVSGEYDEKDLYGTLLKIAESSGLSATLHIDDETSVILDLGHVIKVTLNENKEFVYTDPETGISGNSPEEVYEKIAEKQILELQGRLGAKISHTEGTKVSKLKLNIGEEIENTFTLYSTGTAMLFRDENENEYENIHEFVRALLKAKGLSATDIDVRREELRNNMITIPSLIVKTDEGSIISLESINNMKKAGIKTISDLIALWDELAADDHREFKAKFNFTLEGLIDSEGNLDPNYLDILEDALSTTNVTTDIKFVSEQDKILDAMLNGKSEILLSLKTSGGGVSHLRMNPNDGSMSYTLYGETVDTLSKMSRNTAGGKGYIMKAGYNHLSTDANNKRLADFSYTDSSGLKVTIKLDASVLRGITTTNGLNFLPNSKTTTITLTDSGTVIVEDPSINPTEITLDGSNSDFEITSKIGYTYGVEERENGTSTINVTDAAGNTSSTNVGDSYIDTIRALFYEDDTQDKINEGIKSSVAAALETAKESVKEDTHNRIAGGARGNSVGLPLYGITNDMILGVGGLNNQEDKTPSTFVELSNIIVGDLTPTNVTNTDLKPIDGVNTSGIQFAANDVIQESSVTNEEEDQINEAKDGLVASIISSAVEDIEGITVDSDTTKDKNKKGLGNVTKTLTTNTLFVDSDELAAEAAKLETEAENAKLKAETEEEIAKLETEIEAAHTSQYEYGEDISLLEYDLIQDELTARKEGKTGQELTDLRNKSKKSHRTSLNKYSDKDSNNLFNNIYALSTEELEATLNNRKWTNVTNPQTNDEGRSSWRLSNVSGTTMDDIIAEFIGEDGLILSFPVGQYSAIKKKLADRKLKNSERKELEAQKAALENSLEGILFSAYYYDVLGNMKSSDPSMHLGGINAGMLKFLTENGGILQSPKSLGIRFNVSQNEKGEYVIGYQYSSEDDIRKQKEQYVKDYLNTVGDSTGEEREFKLLAWAERNGVPGWIVDSLSSNQDLPKDETILELIAELQENPEETTSKLQSEALIIQYGWDDEVKKQQDEAEAARKAEETARKAEEAEKLALKDAANLALTNYNNILPKDNGIIDLMLLYAIDQMHFDAMPEDYMSLLWNNSVEKVGNETEERNELYDNVLKQFTEYLSQFKSGQTREDGTEVMIEDWAGLWISDNYEMVVKSGLLEYSEIEDLLGEYGTSLFNIYNDAMDWYTNNSNAIVEYLQENNLEKDALNSIFKIISESNDIDYTMWGFEPLILALGLDFGKFKELVAMQSERSLTEEDYDQLLSTRSLKLSTETTLQEANTVALAAEEGAKATEEASLKTSEAAEETSSAALETYTSAVLVMHASDELDLSANDLSNAASTLSSTSNGGNNSSGTGGLAGGGGLTMYALGWDTRSWSGGPRARGNVGLAKASGTLMGELGPELVVSNGHYYVVGLNGPEMVNLADDAIVFNHLLTRSLLEKGMSSTRGRAVTGENNAVAFATGNANLIAGKGSINTDTINSSLNNISNNIDKVSSKLTTKSSDVTSSFRSLENVADELSSTRIVSNANALSSEAGTLQYRFNRVNYEANQAKRHIRTLGEYAGQAEHPVKRLGDKAEEAQKHVSKFGELTGGAEHDVEDLGNAALGAAQKISEAFGLDFKSSRTLNKTNVSGFTEYIGGKASQDEINVLLKSLNNIKAPKPIKVQVTDSGTVAKVQKQINSIKGTSVAVDVYLKEHKGTENGADYISDATGNVGLARAHGTLMGELGPELVVSNGRYFVVGQNGPEMINLADDAIIFNHLQTKSLLERGISSGRGRAITNEQKAISFAKGNINGGLARASGVASTLAALKQLRAQWKSFEQMSAKDLASKAGGGGGGGNDKAFIRSLERWYNWLQKIAQLEKDINYEESLRSRIASDFDADGYKYYLSQLRSLEDLTDEIVTQKTLLKSQEDYFNKRRDEMNSNNNPFTALYTFNEGGQLQYQKGAFEKLSELSGRNELTGEANYTPAEQYQKLVDMGFEKYMKYDSSGNEIKLKDEGWEATAVQAFWDKIDSDREEMQSLYDSIEDLKKDIESNQLKQNEILKAIEDNQISVENKVLKAMEDIALRNIDTLNDQKEAIQSSNEALINGLSNLLSKERLMYSTKESEADLVAKQRQLAILRRSGGSASEISSLLAEIDSSTRDLYFTKQQEQIDALQEASDNQLKRLDELINILSETLEYLKAHGLLWEQVHAEMKKSPEEIADYIKKNDSEYWGKSPADLALSMRQDLFEAEQWKAFAEKGISTEEYAKQIAETIQSRYEYELKKAEEEEAAAAKNDSGSSSGTSGSTTSNGPQKWGVHFDGTRYVASWDANGKYSSYADAKSARDAMNAAGGYLMAKTDSSEKSEYSGFNGSSGQINGLQVFTVATLKGNGEFDDGRTFTKAIDAEIYRSELEKAGKKTKTTGFKHNARGGYVGHGIYELGEQGTETVLTAQQTQILRNDILGSNHNSLVNLLLDFREAYGGLNEAAYNSINNSDNGVVIEHAEVNMKVELLANSYDAARAADDVMKEMLNIARKTNAQNRVGR